MKTRPMNSCCVVAALLFAIVASGCATYNRIADYPKPGQPTSVSVEAKQLAKMSELPVGAYYDPQRQIVISGHQKGVVGAAIFGGIIGVMIADSANKSSAESRFGDSARSGSTDLNSLTRELLEQAIASQQAPSWTLKAAKAELQLTPFAVFTVAKSGKARLYAMLKAEIPGAGGDPVWSVRYFAQAPGEYTIESTDGWMIGERFAASMRTALKRAIQVCIDDCGGKLKGKSTVTAKGPLPYINDDTIAWRFIVADEAEDAIVGRFVAGDVMVMAGTHVLERADHQIAAASFSDPRK
jgi:hypothetical protein